MSLEPGTTLGSYSVTAKIGEGGMGEVYRARDTKLDRDVALKVLPEAFTSDPDRLARFEREAKLLASLNHPNIGSIYGLEDADGQKALVLELIEGPTLADRIKEGPIPVDEALPIAKQIAEALEAAHEQGVIHRDLKPANVKVKADGTVKVLDFGLAKAFEPEAGSVSASMSPTISLTAAATQMGMVIGTAAYMSPEQARGKPVDRRADIWAFGVVLYEMLAGARPFQGEDVSLTLASVMKSDVDVRRLPPDLPETLRTVLHRCLEKDPLQRIRDMGDVRLAMEGAFDAPSQPGTVNATPLGLLSSQALFLAFGALVVGALIAGVVVWTVARPDPSRVARLSITIDPLYISLTLPDIAISPDGSQVVYKGGTPPSRSSPFWIRPMDQLSAKLVQGTGGLNPFISEDGAWLGFYDAGGLKKVSLLGGPAIPICPIPGGAVVRGASWGSDDMIVFGTMAAGGLWRVYVDGGDPEALTYPDPSSPDENHLWPEILPGGGAVLFTVLSGSVSSAQIAVLNLGSGEHRVLIPGGSYPRYSPTGHIVYGMDGSLYAVAFDLDRLEVTGAPVELVDEVVTKTSGAAGFSLAQDGTLVYIPGRETDSAPGRIVWLDSDGQQMPVPGLESGRYQSVRMSPDGSRLALVIRTGSAEAADVWIYDLESARVSRLTNDPGASTSNPVWMPGGDRVVFGSNRDGPWGLFQMNADGTGEPQRLMTDDEALRLLPRAWSPDGDRLLFTGVYPGTDGDIGLLSLAEEPTIERPLQEASDERHLALSPDGRWLAYSSDRSGQFEVYVERFPEFTSRQIVSTDGGIMPRWSPDGRELYFSDPDRGQLLAVPVSAERRFTVGTPRVASETAVYDFLGRGDYDVAAEAERLVVVTRPGQEYAASGELTHLVLVQNWHTELLERVPVD